MPAAQARPEERPSGRPWRATKRALKREAGRLGAPDDSSQTPSPAGAPAQSPLDFALAFMRDTSKPDALRVSVAKAALPYVHGRWCPVDSDPRDAKPKLPPPFDLPDPYNSLRVDWRDALERAGLVRPAVAARESARAVAPTSTNMPQPLFPPLQGRVAGEARRVGFDAPSTPPGRSLRSRPPSPLCGEAEDERAAPAQLHESAPAQVTEAQERARALEQRATLAEGRLREAQNHARDMEQRALAAEALIAGRR